MNTGVYKIKNIANGKVYVGSTSSSFQKRCNNHMNLLIKGIHGNRILQRSFDKYGVDNFCFIVLTYCNPEDCIQREQEFINLLTPYYNICKVAGSRLGTKYTDESKAKIAKKATGRPVSEETKQKVSESLIGNQRRLGIPHTDDAKLKMSKFQKGRPSKKKGVPLSDETKAKMTIANNRPRLFFTEEYRKNMAEKRKGIKHSQERIENNRRSQCKYIYTITTPSGTTDIFNGSLQLYCKDRSLHPTCLVNTIRGYDNRGYKNDYYKGYRMIRKSLAPLF